MVQGHCIRTSESASPKAPVRTPDQSQRRQLKPDEVKLIELREVQDEVRNVGRSLLPENGRRHPFPDRAWRFEFWRRVEGELDISAKPMRLFAEFVRPTLDTIGAFAEDATGPRGEG